MLVSVLGVLVSEWGVLVSEWGVLVSEWGVLVSEWGVLISELDVLVSEWGVLVSEWGVLVYMHLSGVLTYCVCVRIYIYNIMYSDFLFCAAAIHFEKHSDLCAILSLLFVILCNKYYNSNYLILIIHILFSMDVQSITELCKKYHDNNYNIYPITDRYSQTYVFRNKKLGRYIMFYKRFIHFIKSQSTYISSINQLIPVTQT